MNPHLFKSDPNVDVVESIEYFINLVLKSGIKSHQEYPLRLIDPSDLFIQQVEILHPTSYVYPFYLDLSPTRRFPRQ